MEPNAIEGEIYVTTVETETSRSVKLRVYCTGPHFDIEKKLLSVTTPSFLLEAGGGAAGIDLIGL